MIDEDLFNSKSESPIEERFWIIAQPRIEGLKQQYSIIHNFCILYFLFLLHHLGIQFDLNFIPSW